MGDVGDDYLEFAVDELAPQVELTSTPDGSTVGGNLLIVSGTVTDEITVKPFSQPPTAPLEPDSALSRSTREPEEPESFSRATCPVAAVGRLAEVEAP